MRLNTLIAAAFSSGSAFAALRSDGRSRHRLFFAMSLSSAYALTHARSCLDSDTLSGIFAWFLVFHWLHMVNLLYVHRIQHENKVWQETLYWLYNPRWIGTDRSAMRQRGDGTKIPADNTLHSAIPENFAWIRLRYTCRKLVLIVLKMAALYVSRSIPRAYNPFGFRNEDFSRDKRSIVRRLIRGDPNLDLRHEGIVRCWAVVNIMFDDWASVGAAQDAFAILFVGLLRVHEPADWPPLFGRLSEVTSMRTWYSRFWHMFLYRPGIDIGTWLIGGKIGQVGRGYLHRIVLAAFVFLVSAMNHMVFVWAFDGQVAWRQLQWWMLQPVILTLEDLAQATWKAMKRHESSRSTAMAEAWLGRLWVWSFLFWAIMKFQY